MGKAGPGPLRQPGGVTAETSSMRTHRWSLPGPLQMPEHESRTDKSLEVPSRAGRDARRGSQNGKGHKEGWPSHGWHLQPPSSDPFTREFLIRSLFRNCTRRAMNRVRGVFKLFRRETVYEEMVQLCPNTTVFTETGGSWTGPKDHGCP